jgi:hypothetical protein
MDGTLLSSEGPAYSDGIRLSLRTVLGVFRSNSSKRMTRYAAGIIHSLFQRLTLGTDTQLRVQRKFIQDAVVQREAEPE